MKKRQQRKEPRAHVHYPQRPVTGIYILELPRQLLLHRDRQRMRFDAVLGAEIPEQTAQVSVFVLLC